MSFWVKIFIAVICVSGVANADEKASSNTFSQSEAEALLRAQTILRKHFINAIGEVRNKIVGSEDYENILNYIIKGLHTRELDPTMAMRNIPANHNMYEYKKLGIAIYNLQGNTQNRKKLEEWNSVTFFIGVSTSLPLININFKRLDYFRRPYVNLILKELKNTIKPNTQLIRDAVYNYPFVNLSPDLDVTLNNFLRTLRVDFKGFKPQKNSKSPSAIMLDILNFIKHRQSIVGLELIQSAVRGEQNIGRIKDTPLVDLFGLIQSEEYPLDVIAAKINLLNDVKNNQVLFNRTEMSNILKGYTPLERLLGLIYRLSWSSDLALGIYPHIKLNYLSSIGEYFRPRGVSDVRFLFTSFLTIPNPMNPTFVTEIPKLFTKEMLDDIEYSHYTKPRELVLAMTNALLLSNTLKPAAVAMLRFFLKSNGYKEVHSSSCEVSALVIDPVSLLEITPPEWREVISSQPIPYENFKNLTKQKLIKEIIKSDGALIPEDSRPPLVMTICEKSKCPKERLVRVINPSDLIRILNFPSGPIMELIMKQLIFYSRYGKYRTQGEVYRAVMEDRKEEIRDRYPDIDLIIQSTALNYQATLPAKFIKVCLKTPLCPPHEEFKLIIDPKSLLDTIDNIKPAMRESFPKGPFLADKYRVLGNRETVLRQILRQHYSSSNGKVIYPELMKLSMKMILNEKAKRPPAMVEKCVGPGEPEMNSTFVYDIVSTFDALENDEGIEFILERTKNYFIPTREIYNKAEVLELIFDTLGPEGEDLKGSISHTGPGKETPIVKETKLPTSILGDEKTQEATCENGEKIITIVDNEKLLKLLKTDSSTAAYLKSKLQQITTPIGNPEKYTKGDILTSMLLQIESETTDGKIKKIIESLKTSIYENEQAIELPDVIQVCLPGFVIEEIQADNFAHHPSSGKPSSTVPPKSTTIQPPKSSIKPKTTPASHSTTSQPTKSPTKPKTTPASHSTTPQPTKSPTKPKTTMRTTQPPKPETTIKTTVSSSKPETTVRTTHSPSKPPTTTPKHPPPPPPTTTPKHPPPPPPTTTTKHPPPPPPTTTTKHPPPPPPTTTTKRPPPPPPPTTTTTTTRRPPPPPPPPTTTTTTRRPPPPPPPPPTTTTTTTTSPPPPPPTEKPHSSLYDYIKEVEEEAEEALEYLLS